MPFRLAEIASQIGADLKGDSELVISGLATLETACKGDLSYIASPKYRKLAYSAKASAIIAYPGFETDKHDLLVAKDPYLAFAKAMRFFYRCFPQIDPKVEKTAVIASDVSALDDAYIGHYAVISKGSRLGRRTIIRAGAFIGENAILGDNCYICEHVVIGHEVKIGNNVVIYPGAIIGSDGFGYARDGFGQLKIPQVGTVVIEDNVEIGAGTTIDRATLGETIIGKNTIIDNLVQIAHNCKIGQGCILCAQAGLAGSTILEDNVVLAGQVGVAGHLTIGRGAVVEAKSGVAADIPEGAVHFGIPSREVGLAHKIEAMLNRLPDYVKRIRKLESFFKESKNLN